MSVDYSLLLKDYPNELSLEQMYKVCHISKKTARLLLSNGLIPFKSTGRQTHKYRISKDAVIQYLFQREVTPEKYLLLNSTFQVTDDFEAPLDLDRFEDYPDVLNVRQAAELANVIPATIQAWARKKHIKAFQIRRKLHIPKLSLIEYLASPLHRVNSIYKQNLSVTIM